MADQMSAFHAQFLQKLLEGIRKRIKARIGDRFHGAALPRKIKRIDRPASRNCVDIEQPVIQVTTEPMDEDDSVAVTRSLNVPQTATCSFGKPIDRTLVLIP